MDLKIQQAQALVQASAATTMKPTLRAITSDAERVSVSAALRALLIARLGMALRTLPLCIAMRIMGALLRCFLIWKVQQRRSRNKGRCNRPRPRFSRAA